MPYTNPWSDTDPPGSQAANTIDDELRQLRLDIHERMDDIVADWTADPVVPVGGASAGSFGVQYGDLGVPGSKASEYIGIVSTLTINWINGSTNSVGEVTINLNEINTLTGDTDWQVANLFNPGGGSYLPLAFVGRYIPAPSRPIAIQSTAVSSVGNTITLLIRRQDAGSVSNIQIEFTILLGFTTAP